MRTRGDVGRFVVFGGKTVVVKCRLPVKAVRSLDVLSRKVM